MITKTSTAYWSVGPDMRARRTTICPATGHPSTWRCTVASAIGGLLLIVFELTYWWKSDVGTRWVDRQGERLITWKRTAAQAVHR